MTDIINIKKRVATAIVVMGFSGLVAEIILLRELLIVFSGNELCIGIILANWLILEAFGCFVPGRLAERSRYIIETFIIITILFSLSLLGSIFLTRNLKNILGISIGETIGLIPIFYSSFLILLPVSVFHGALFTFSCRIYSLFLSQESSLAGKVYIYETIGTIIGGIACAYLLIPHVNTFQLSAVIMVFNFITGIILLPPLYKNDYFKKMLMAVLCLLVISSLFLLFNDYFDKLHKHSINLQWKNLNIVHYQNSQYGNICVIENEQQYIFFQDGIPSLMTPVPDIIFLEEFVHIPLLSHPKPSSILILGGGAGGMINEILKHPSVEMIEYAELDPLLLSLLKKFPTPLTESELNDDRVIIKHVDGIRLLKTTPHQFDVIIVGIMEASNLQTNRFFTKEFFSLAKSKLKKDGMIVLGVPGSLTLASKELKNLNSCIFHTLHTVFPQVRVILGDHTNLFLASDSLYLSTVDKDLIIERLNKLNIVTNELVPWHIENKLHEGWHKWFFQFIGDSTQKINYDYKPLGLFYNISSWNALHAPSFGRIFKQFEHINIGLISILIVFFLIFYFLLYSTNNTSFSTGIAISIITTGFAGMIFDLVIIFAFQSIYGYVFFWIGFLVTSFMIGASLGAFWTTKTILQTMKTLKRFILLEIAIITLAIVVPLLLVEIKSLIGSRLEFLSLVIFILISSLCGFLIGAQFPLANNLYEKNGSNITKTAGLLYASDLIGGWLGGIIGAVLLLPILGVIGTCITVALIKLASLIILTIQSQSKHYLQ